MGMLPFEHAKDFFRIPRVHPQPIILHPEHQVVSFPVAAKGRFAQGPGT
jgi:hypothetical protein